MSKVRTKKRARPSWLVADEAPQSGKTVAIVSPKSLPPSGSDNAASASNDAKTVPSKKEWWYRDKSSKAYEQAMKIFAMSAAGITDKEIAHALKITEQSMWNVRHVAGKNGWVSDQLAKAKDVVEFQIIPKALRVIEDGLEDAHRNEKTGLQVKQHIALKIADGAIWNREQVAAGIAQGTVLAIKIEMAPGTPQTMREGTGGGVPAYVEGEVVHDVGQQSGLISTRGPEI